MKRFGFSILAAFVLLGVGAGQLKATNLIVNGRSRPERGHWL